MRDSFVFYKSFAEALAYVDDAARLKCYDAIVKYALYGEEIELNGVPKVVFELVRPQIDANNKRYEDGKKGGRPKKDVAKATKSLAKDSKSKQKLANASNCQEQEKPKPIKHKYGQYQNVLLTDEELEQWKKEHPNDWEHWIEELSNGIASKGYKYKDFLATLRNWAKREGVYGGNAGATISSSTSNQRKEYDEIDRIIGW